MDCVVFLVKLAMSQYAGYVVMMKMQEMYTRFLLPNMFRIRYAGHDKSGRVKLKWVLRNKSG
jgi:hypothetical protein